MRDVNMRGERKKYDVWLAGELPTLVRTSGAIYAFPDIAAHYLHCHFRSTYHWDTLLNPIAVLPKISSECVILRLYSEILSGSYLDDIVLRSWDFLHFVFLRITFHLLNELFRQMFFDVKLV